ncbi:hypothetical protein Droror1_Dr00024500, partial [Drosera rotundifolia]
PRRRLPLLHRLCRSGLFSDFRNALSLNQARLPPNLVSSPNESANESPLLGTPNILSSPKTKAEEVDSTPRTLDFEIITHPRKVVDATGEKLLALFPAKFQKSMWIKRGSFGFVDASGRTEAVESGHKVACVVLRVPFYKQVRRLQKHEDWPEIFRSASIESSNKDLSKTSPQLEDEANSSEDDGLPLLEANTNRMRPFGLHTYHDSDTDTES